MQYNPIHGETKKNMEKVDQMLKDIKKDEVDLVVFPEMAFTGYTFESRDHISPLLEDEKEATFQYCRDLAKKLNCHVIAGFPEISKKVGTPSRYYNSACFVSPLGELITTYRKSFLYETDKTWAEEGGGFTSLKIQSWGERENFGIGICMDINPYEYIDSRLYEFANFHKSRGTKLLVLCANWLEGENTQLYWLNRLRPMIGSDCIFIVANRIGTENGCTFCGRTCAMSLKEPLLLQTLGTKEGLMTVEFE